MNITASLIKFILFVTLVYTTYYLQSLKTSGCECATRNKWYSRLLYLMYFLVVVGLISDSSSMFRRNLNKSAHRQAIGLYISVCLNMALVAIFIAWSRAVRKAQCGCVLEREQRILGALVAFRGVVTVLWIILMGYLIVRADRRAARR